MEKRVAQASLVGKAIVEEASRVFLGKPLVVELAVTALLARGHVLLEEVPGAGKTLLARAIARAIGGAFRRVQFTADLLPSDITGVSVWSARQERFLFREGPIFANVVLADEINRASPRTQSAMLEAMSEGQVSCDGESRALPRPFMVIATQNPHEHHGTYMLPESELDRFIMRLTIGYPDPDVERHIVAVGGYADKVDTTVRQVTDPEAVREAQGVVDDVTVPDAVMGYAMGLVAATRTSEPLRAGLSTRGAVNLLAAARAHAVLRGRAYCIPDDVKAVFVAAGAHRVQVRHQADGSARDEAAAILSEILSRYPVPGD